MNTFTAGASGNFDNISQPSRQFDRSDFSSFVSSHLTFAEHGDKFEQQFAKEAPIGNFPAYQKVWQLIVVPATNRLTGNDSDVTLRENISDEVLLLCQFHYTISCALLRAIRHKESKSFGFLFDFFCSLQNACEQAELFILAHSIVFEEKFTWDELVEQTGGLKNSRDNFLQQSFLYSDHRDIWNDFRTTCGSISHMRNALAHGPEVATYTQASGPDLVPRISKHEELLWTALPSVNDKYKLRGYFIDPDKATNDLLIDFFRHTNALWDSIVTRFENTSPWDGQAFDFYIKKRNPIPPQ